MLMWPLGLGIAGAAFLADQLTKHLVLANAAAILPAVPIVPGLNLVLVRNTGVTFGFLADLPAWTLAAFAGAVVIWLAVWLRRSGSPLTSVTLGLMIGGALGNTLDRVRFAGVTDFIDVYLGRYHWPAFNLADVAIVSGVLLLVAQSLLRSSPATDDAVGGR
ncbi:signal peptidase II [Acuticoccus yangtzensis]|uniref:signal peptidase II n=1 Tax=Acuticoccus yangtzensis TaxID=1443441 RepID=UPI000A68EB0A|nr:signal peptidase II [Acuticoccus yangtzensis]